MRHATRFPVVLIAASRGGPRALSTVLSSLPSDFPGAVVVVQHRAQVPGSRWLADALRQATTLPVRDLAAGMHLRPGVVYIAPATTHTHIGDDRVFRLIDGRRIRGVRASANPLFATAAKTCGVDVIAVVLTGYGRDATDGVQTVRVHGGLVIAQDEATSRDFGMPRSAIESSAVDVVLPLERIGPFISELVSRRGQAQTATG